MIHFNDVRLNYNPENGISIEQFESSMIFPMYVSKYSSEDYVSGTIGQTAISFSEVHAKSVSRDSDGHKSSQDIFRGLFFVADLNIKFSSRTIIVPDIFGDSLGGFGRFLQKEGIWGGTEPLIKLEDPEFENYFAVYGSNQIDTKYILSPTLMSRILEFRKENGYLWLSFVDGKMYLALPVKNIFEPRIFRSTIDVTSMKKYFHHVSLMVKIVEDFNLNTKT